MPHYYSEKQDSKLDLKKIKIKTREIEFELYSASGVFSKKKIDKGTKLLIENCVVRNKILDMGCGVGVIGIAMKLLYPYTEIVMADINERAVMVANKNIKLHKLSGIKVIKSNLYENIKDKFDTILVNPPQTAGKKICFNIIEEAPKVLQAKGLFELVARHNKGGKHLCDKMYEVFGNVKEISKASGYRLYCSTAP